MTTLSSSMPDTSGINFFTADADLSLLLRQHLTAEDFERSVPILTRMGAVASHEMEALAVTANREAPVVETV